MVAIAPPEMEPRLAGWTGSLPLRCPPFETALGRLVAHDLPWPTSGPQAVLNVHGKQNHEACHIRMAGFLAKPSRYQYLSGRDCEESKPEHRLYDFLDNLVRNAQELRWEAEQPAGKGKNPSSTTALLPLSWDILPGVLTSRDDQPRMGLIVRLVQQIGDRLVRLCERPRRVLRRTRKKAPIGRVQQVDGACLQWLVRQPGRTATEKAGARQQILAVEREEDHDTLENRVLKDMVRRCNRLADRWLRDNRRHHANDLYREIDRFRRRCTRILREPVMTEIMTVRTVTRPNYVLQHDSAYHEMWQWYLRVVQQENDIDAVWPWQGRLWAETMRLYAAAALMTFRETVTLHSHSLWLRQRPEGGRWIAEVDWPGPVVFQGEQGHRIVAECIEPSCISEDGNHPATWELGKGLCMLGADFAMHFSALSSVPSRQVCLAIWALHTCVDAGDGDQELIETCRDIADALRGITFSDPSCRIYGLVLMSGFLSGYQRVEDFVIQDTGESRVYGCRVPGNPDEWSGNLNDLLHMILDDVAGSIA